MPASVEVEVGERWEALRLSQRLVSYRPFLVEYGPARWLVHVEAPGYHGERLAAALSEIEHWVEARHPARVMVRVDGRPYLLPADRQPA